MSAKLEPDGDWPRFTHRIEANGGCLPDSREAHALWYFMLTAHRLLKRVEKQVVYEIGGVRDGPTEAEILHNLWRNPAEAAARLYGVTLDEMFAAPNVRAAIREIQLSGLVKGEGLAEADSRVLGWIASGGSEHWVPRLGSYWFNAID